MELQNHTPTPWTITRPTYAADTRFFLNGKDPKQAFGTNYEGDHILAVFNKREDAEFAFRACNAHDALVEALEDAQNGLRWYQEAHPEDASGADDEMHKKIDAALALAKAGS